MDPIKQNFKYTQASRTDKRFWPNDGDGYPELNCPPTGFFGFDFRMAVWADPNQRIIFIHRMFFRNSINSGRRDIYGAFNLVLMSKCQDILSAFYVGRNNIIVTPERQTGSSMNNIVLTFDCFIEKIFFSYIYREERVPFTIFAWIVFGD